MSPRPPAPTYKYILVQTRPTAAPYRVRVRVADCHPENKHHSRGVCEVCHSNKRRPAAAPEKRRLKCRNCGRRFRPGAEEVPPEEHYCSFSCQAIHLTTRSKGDGWRAQWPGARYRLLADVPPRCPRERCGALLQETVTGVVCSACGTEYHVAECLVRALVHGRQGADMRSAESVLSEAADPW